MHISIIHSNSVMVISNKVIRMHISIIHSNSVMVISNKVIHMHISIIHSNSVMVHVVYFLDTVGRRPQ